jgi:hypothetical protein
MIERNGNCFDLLCDYCSNYIEEFEDFQEAVYYKRANGWKSINIKGEWTDKCPDCLAKVDDK